LSADFLLRGPIFSSAKRFSLPRGEILFGEQIFRTAVPIFSSQTHLSVRRSDFLFGEALGGTAEPIFSTLWRFPLRRGDFRFAEPIFVSRSGKSGWRSGIWLGEQLLHFAEHNIAPRSRSRLPQSLPLSPERPLDDRVQTREGGVHAFVSSSNYAAFLSGP